MTSNQCAYCGYEDGKHNAVCVAAEVGRLTSALMVANANHERFEREWYLRGDEIERLTRERDEWAAKWHAMRKLYAELKYPGMTGVVRPAEQQVETNEVNSQTGD